MGHSFYLLALSQYLDPPESVTVVIGPNAELQALRDKLSFDTNIMILNEPSEEYRLLNGKTTYYICKNQSCLPPVNEI